MGSTPTCTIHGDRHELCIELRNKALRKRLYAALEPASREDIKHICERAISALAVAES